MYTGSELKIKRLQHCQQCAEHPLKITEPGGVATGLIHPGLPPGVTDLPVAEDLVPRQQQHPVVGEQKH